VKTAVEMTAKMVKSRRLAMAANMAAQSWLKGGIISGEDFGYHYLATKPAMCS